MFVLDMKLAVIVSQKFQMKEVFWRHVPSPQNKRPKMPTNYLARNLNGVLLDFETILAIRPKNYLKMDYVHVKIPCFVYNIICLSVNRPFHCSKNCKFLSDTTQATKCMRASRKKLFFRSNHPRNNSVGSCPM